MTKSEIIKSYREAKYKREQIKIISELACKPVKDIEDILVAAGETLPPKKTYKKKTESTPEEKKEEKTEEIKGVRIKRNENGLLDPEEDKEEPTEGRKFFDALEKDIESENKPKKLKDLPEHVKIALINELRRLDAQMEDIQKKKAEIIDFMVSKDEANA